MATEVSYSPDHSIRTNLNVHVELGGRLRLDDIERAYLRPVQGFTTFAADRWDDATFEVVRDPSADADAPVRVLRAGRTVSPRAWRPGNGRYLFLADDCSDIPALLTRWFDLYERAGLPIAVFAETLRNGSSWRFRGSLTA